MVKPNQFDTKPFGLLKAFNTKRKFFKQPSADMVQAVFDTGVILFIPVALADNYVFHLEEADPE